MCNPFPGSWNAEFTDKPQRSRWPLESFLLFPAARLNVCPASGALEISEHPPIPLGVEYDLNLVTVWIA